MQGSEGRGPETVPSLPGSSEASRQREGASLEPWHVQVTLMKRSEDRGHSRVRALRRDCPSPALCAALNLPAQISGLRPRVRGATKEVQKLCAPRGPGGATRTLLAWGQGPTCVGPPRVCRTHGPGQARPPPPRPQGPYRGRSLMVFPKSGLLAASWPLSFSRHVSDALMTT